MELFAGCKLPRYKLRGLLAAGYLVLKYDFLLLNMMWHGFPVNHYDQAE